ncbi:MAG TPA: selenocysteine-specific translation elongation factor [Steroidobacteraceae bacterium]|nr:selenocysteine-specific translation elongation factor [Steroidobacteraceae bacterium]
MIVGTAGHIDHGKTSLVRALTGVDTDRLKEEKERGISIELGYAYTPLANGEVLGFVDVPGHERLVHTMIAGVGGIDFALLVIAADDGIMPQTREHLAILGLLGVAHGAVALTKIDRVDSQRVREVESEIRAAIATTALRAAPIFPLDATTAADSGVAALREHLNVAAQAQPARPADGLFRLAVDRVFTLPGHGTIAAGTVRNGLVRVGDTVAVMPRGDRVRVRSIHAQNRIAETGSAGQRCALNLAGIDRTALSRGDWLADPQALNAGTRLDVNLSRLADGGAALADRAPLHIYLGTLHRVARLSLLDADKWMPGARVRAQLKFDAPVCAAAGDLLIVRDAQAVHTIGGGVVLDPSAPARRRRAPERRAYLDAVEGLLAGEGIAPLLQQAPQGIEMQELVRLCGCAPERIPLPEPARVVDTVRGRYAFQASHWQALRDRALGALKTFHAERPDEPGADRALLRRMTLPSLADPVWRALIAELVQEKAVRHSGHWLHLPEHRATLSGGEQTLAGNLLASIAAGGFDPPWVRDLATAAKAPEEEVRSVLRKCVIQGLAYQVVRDLFYDRERVRELAQALRQVAQAHGNVEAARYRDAIGVGRKRAIQILEFFDRVGYTRRTRDARVLRADSGWHPQD